MKFLTTTIAALLFSVSAMAASGVLGVEATTLNAKTNYTLTESGYDLSELTGSLLTKSSGTGIFANVNQSQVQELSTQMPNERLGEFAKLSVERTSARTANLHSQMLKNTDAGPYAESSVAEIELINGTWSDVDAGKQVSAHLTKKGEQQTAANNNLIAQNMVKMMVTAFRQQGVNLRLIKSKIETSKNDTLLISKDKIEMNQAYLKFTLVMSLSAR